MKLAHKGPLALKVYKAKLVCRERLVLKALKESREFRGQLDQKDPKDQQVLVLIIWGYGFRVPSIFPATMFLPPQQMILW